MRTGLLGLKRSMIEYEGSRNEFLKLLAEFDEVPAFVARARAPLAALDILLSDCQAKQEQMLEWPRFHWAVLANHVARKWNRLDSLLTSSDAVAMLENLDMCLRTDKSVHYRYLLTDRTVLRRFLESAERFNRSWTRHLGNVDLEPVNRPRRDYNDYYVVEKACALGSEALIRNFVPLTMIDRAFLVERFPLLVCPSLK